MFFILYNMISGGFVGVGMIIGYLMYYNIGVFIFLLNIFFFILSYFYLGKKIIFLIVYFVVVLLLVMNIILVY